MTNIKLKDPDIITIHFTLGECIKECPNKGFVRQTKSLLKRYEKAMVAAGICGYELDGKMIHFVAVK